VDAGSVLGLQPLRSSFLDNVPAAESRQAEAGDGAGVVTSDDICRVNYVLDDDDPDDDEDDDDFDEDDDDPEDDEDEEDEEVETWQVSGN
jgi:hypothetical protein